MLSGAGMATIAQLMHAYLMDMTLPYPNIFDRIHMSGEDAERFLSKEVQVRSAGLLDAAPSVVPC